jgi:hypothetical protein
MWMLSHCSFDVGICFPLFFGGSNFRKTYMAEFSEFDNMIIMVMKVIIKSSSLLIPFLLVTDQARMVLRKARGLLLISCHR